MAFAAPMTVSSSGRYTTRSNLCRKNTLPVVRRPSTGAGARMVAEVQSDVAENATEVFSGAGMSVEEFFQSSMGSWKSQRSSHTLAWGQFEAVTSEIDIEPLEMDDADVVAMCAAQDIKYTEESGTFALRMAWEGESDWDDEPAEMKGSTILVVLKSSDSDEKGTLYRSMGYAQEIPAVGTWEITADGTFVLVTPYEMAAAEERIWFATKDLRMRVSQIRTSSGRGVVTASFSTEIRRLPPADKEQ